MTKKETCEKKWRLLACAVALFICAGVSAQTAVVTGRVLDGGHEPLIGANVTEKGTANMAVTNAEGDFAFLFVLESNFKRSVARC